MTSMLLPRRRAVPAVAALLALLSFAACATAAPPADGTPRRAATFAQTAADVPPTPRLTPVDRWFGESRALSVDGGVIFYGVGRSIAVAYYNDDTPDKLQFHSRSTPLPLAAPDAPPAPITDLAFGQPGVWAITGETADGVAFFDYRGRVLQLVGRAMLDAGDAPLALAAIGDEAIVTVGDPEGTRQGGLVMLRADAAGVPHIVGRWRDPLGARGLFAPSDVLWVIETGELTVGGIGDGQALVRLKFEPGADGTVSFEVIRRLDTPVSNIVRLAEDVVNSCIVYGIEGSLVNRDDFGSLWVFDTCAPTSDGSGGIRVLGHVQPSNVGGIALTSVAADVSAPNRVLVADVHGGIWAIRTRDPGAMSWPDEPFVAPLSAKPACHTALFAHSDTIFAAGCGLRVLETRLDDSTPDLSLRIVRRASLPNIPSYGSDWDLDFATPGGAYAVAAGGLVYYNVASTISIIDPGAPDAPKVVGQTQVTKDDWEACEEADFAVDGGTAWAMTTCESYVTAIDVRNQQQPRVIGDIGGLIATLVAAGSGLVAAMSNDSTDTPLKLYDVADPAMVRLVAELPIRLRFNGDLAIVDERLFVAAGFEEGLHVFDVRDPAHPKKLGSDVSEAARRKTALAVADDVLATMGGRDLTLYGLDRFPDGTLVRLSGLTLPVPDPNPLARPYVALTRIDSRLIAVAAVEDRLVAVDVTDPSTPIVGEPYRLMTPVKTMAVEGDRAYVWGRGLGADMTVFEVSALAIVRRLQLPLLQNSRR